MTDFIQCPKLDLKFSGKCPVYSCFYNDPSSESNCTVLGTINPSENNVLSRLSGHSDAASMRVTSQQMVVLGATIVTHLMIYERDLDKIYCSCGIVKNNCGGKLKATCENRKRWVDWLLKFYNPLFANYPNLLMGERANILLRSIQLYKKQNELPNSLKLAAESWDLNRRVL